jgi:hypothetical protein
LSRPVEQATPRQQRPPCLFAIRINYACTRHHLVAFGKPLRLDRLRTRWDKLVSIIDASAARLDAAAVGVSDGSAIPVRPDGFVGFRADPADAATMDALDTHLASYLIPNSVAT